MLNVTKCQDADYIDFLIASPRSASCTEAAAARAPTPDAPSHDAFTRLLTRLEPDPDTLRREARPLVHRRGGLPVLDDSTLDKPYARKIELVGRDWSGKHKRVVSGIDLITMVWTDGDRVIPCDYRLYDEPNDGLTKDDHLLAMIAAAASRGFAPERVAFDGRYSGLENLKAPRGLGWRWLTRLTSNRLVDLDRLGDRAVCEAAIEAGGTVVHRQGYGMVRVFRIVPRDGDTEHWATDDLAMDDLTRRTYAERSWGIENYHRGLKQCCGVGRSQARSARSERNHIGMAIRAFLRLERNFFTTGVSWYEAKARIIRGAVRAYIAKPLYNLT
jgi:putative transposase